MNFKTPLLLASFLALSCGKSSSSDDSPSSSPLQGSWQMACWYLGANTSGNLGGHYQRASFEFASNSQFTFISYEHSADCTDSNLNEKMRITGTYTVSSSNVDFLLTNSFVTPNVTTSTFANYWKSKCPKLDFTATKETDITSCDEAGNINKTFYNTFEIKDGKTLCFGDGSDFAAAPLLGGFPAASDRLTPPSCTRSFSKQ